MEDTSTIMTTNEQKRTTKTQKEKQEYIEIRKTKMNKNNNLKSDDSPWRDWIRTYRCFSTTVA
jgi:FtsZ-binding cell division protein ZapB